MSQAFKNLLTEGVLETPTVGESTAGRSAGGSSCTEYVRDFTRHCVPAAPPAITATLRVIVGGACQEVLWQCH